MPASEDQLAAPPEPSFQRANIICKIDDQNTSGWVLRRDLSSSERLIRGLKLSGIFLLCAAIAVFIPILHFVLVPLLLLLSLVMGVAVWLTRGEILSGEAACPNCGVINNLNKQSEDWPRTQRCTGCSMLLTFEITTPNA